MVNEAYLPQRGDCIELDFDPQAGNEIQKRRPAVVISSREYNRITGLVMVCPVTSTIRKHYFEVKVPEKIRTIKGVILADQLRTLDWRARNASYKCRIPKIVFEEVIAKINVIVNNE